MNSLKPKIITIHQPDFIPWLGFFDRWNKSDLFIILDDVQFLRQGWHHRDKIKTPNGSKWLTIPIKKKGKYFQDINQTRIDESGNWRKDHLNLISSLYKKAPQFNKIYPEIEKLYTKKTSNLMEFNLDFLFFIAKKIEIKTSTVFSSEYSINAKGTNRLVELVKQFKGTIYLTGTGSKSYLDESLFLKENIKVKWHDFTPPSYNQLYNGFEPMLSILDMMMMMPQSQIKEILKEEKECLHVN